MRTVNVEPPLTHQVLLVEDGAVGAQEGVLLASKGAVLANMEDLAAGFRCSVGVIAWYRLGIAGEAGVRYGGQDGVVLPGHAAPRNVLSQGGNGRVYSISTVGCSIAVAGRRSVTVAGRRRSTIAVADTVEPVEAVADSSTNDGWCTRKTISYTYNIELPSNL